MIPGQSAWNPSQDERLDTGGRKWSRSGMAPVSYTVEGDRLGPARENGPAITVFIAIEVPAPRVEPRQCQPRLDA